MNGCSGYVSFFVIHSFITTVASLLKAPTTDEVIRVNETNNITIECRAEGLPTPIITLTHDTDSMRVIKSSSAVMLQPSGVYEVTQTFTLIEAEDHDSGTFSCTAESMIPEVNVTNPTFSDTINFQLVVQSKLYQLYSMA